MSFLTKLLAPKQTVTLAEHDAIVSSIRDLVEDAQQSARLSDEAVQVAERQIQQERNTIGNLVQRNRELQTQLLAARAEAEANKADAEKYRRSRANLALGTAASAAKRKARAA